MTTSVVIAAGGTGGHLVPALAVADALRKDPTVTVAFIGTRRALDRDLVPRAGYRSHATSVRPFVRGARGLLAPPSLVPATMQAGRILRQERASVVLGMGGYASVPVVAAARLARIPSLIHEANAVPGLANEIAARLTSNIAVSFAATAFPGRAPRLIGVPLRASIAHLDRVAARPGAIEHFGLDPAMRTVLIFGGSQGAARINAAAVGLAERWRDRRDVQIMLSAGPSHDVSLVRGHVAGYIDRMDLAYAAADVVVGRSGASTVAELAAVGLPSILVPLPFARRLEQHANARTMVAAGGASVIDDASLDADGLAAALDELFAHPERLRSMGLAARALGRPDAADAMAAWVLACAKDRRG